MKERRILPLVVMSAGTFLAGVVSSHTWLALPAASAQSTQSGQTVPKAFLAADERTEPVIREILATIKKMDQRLENIEKSVTGGKRVGDASETSTRGRAK